MLLFESQRARCLLSLTHYLELAALVPQIIKYELGSCLSLGEDPACETDFHVFEVLACLDMLVFRYESTHGFIMRGVGPMNVEMRGAVEFAGGARSDLCILLRGKDKIQRPSSLLNGPQKNLHLASIQLPERQQTPFSRPGVGRLPLWPPSSPHAPSLSDVSSAHSCCDRVRRSSDWSGMKANLIFSPEGSSVGSMTSCPSFVRIGSFTGRSFSS